MSTSFDIVILHTKNLNLSQIGAQGVKVMPGVVFPCCYAWVDNFSSKEDDV